jgi:hypothetical protein
VEERETTHTRLAAATNRILAEVNEPQMVDVEVDAESTNS